MKTFLKYLCLILVFMDFYVYFFDIKKRQIAIQNELTQLRETLEKTFHHAEEAHSLAGSCNQMAYTNNGMLWWLRKRQEGRKSPCPHTEICGTNKWVGVSPDDGFCQICRPYETEHRFFHHDDPDGTPHGVYAGKNGWYVPMDMIDLHNLRLKYGSETCDICAKRERERTK